MFGHDDNQQQNSDNNDPIQAAMPDPIVPDNQIPTPSPLFGTPPAAKPVQDLTTPELPSEGTPDAIPVAINAGDNDLLDLKQQALQHLSPLVNHLDQSAEERFRTTMMMIQASDDQSLIKSAFEAAQQIEDEKARAQALLDVINEINYFTQNKT